MIIISIVGHPASGKDTAGDYIAEKGFIKISSSDYLRAEMKKLGLPIDRPSMQAFSSEMRKIYGNGYPAGDIVKQISDDTVVVSFRNTAEVKVLQDMFGKDFTLLAVETPPEIRYKWAKERNRIGDNISYEDFLKAEEIERSDASGSHEMDKVIAMADVLIVNDGTKEDLFRKLDEFIAKLR